MSEKQTMKSNDDGHLVLIREEHSGRDEMNLAGNPFATLFPPSQTNQSTIQLEWDKTLPNGKIVKATWEVNGHNTLGLPGPNDELLFLVLMQLTREQSGSGEWVKEVYFSRFDLLQRLGWPNTKKYYTMLAEGFARLSTVTIRAQHAFWDAKVKEYATEVTFHILEDSRFFDETKGIKKDGAIPKSWFRWNSTVHESFLSGNVRSLALNFVISLDLPTTRRLFRFIDMMRGAATPPRREFTIGIFKLCERLGMTSYKYPSKIKEKLAPAIEELQQRGYLESVRYEQGKNGENATFRFANVSLGTLPTQTVETPRTPPKRRKQAIAVDVEITEGDIRADAMKCYEIFQSLSEDEQGELLAMAREQVQPIFWDRVGQPESPMSLGLWQLIVERYPNRVRSQEVMTCKTKD